MRLWVTRPEPDAADQARDVERLGHTALVEPLITIRFRDREPLPTTIPQAVLATSRNGLRALARRPQEHARLRGLPLLAVGEATASLGRELGFAHVIEAGGTGEALAAAASAHCKPEAGALLHLAGDKLAFDLKGALTDEGFEVEQPIVYKSVARRRLTMATQEAIRSNAVHGVILMSPRTAQIYLRLMQRHGFVSAARNLHHFCLSSAISAQLAPLASPLVSTAAAPRRAELLALIGEATAH